MQDFITFISNHTELSIPIAILIVFLIVVELMRAKRKTSAITPLQATQMINHDNAVVIDIRPNEIFRKGHIINAESMSAADLRTPSKKLEKYKNRPLLIVCSVGMESQKVTTQLIKHGYNAYSLTGGIRGWSEAQMPLIKE